MFLSNWTSACHSCFAAILAQQSIVCPRRIWTVQECWRKRDSLVSICMDYGTPCSNLALQSQCVLAAQDTGLWDPKVYTVVLYIC